MPANAPPRADIESHVVADGTRITLVKPDDFHHHFRDGAKVPDVLSHASERFARCIAMPNLKPPIVNAAMAAEYRDHILKSLPTGAQFEPLMTLYLTDVTTPDEIRRAHATGFVKAVKFYPAGATTNSEFGVTDIKKTYPTLKVMGELGLVLCIHSEVTGPAVDIFDREGLFIENIMKPLVRDMPELKLVMEHISTEEAVNYILQSPPNVRATITCHHLLYNRNALLVGGIKPHYYCLPILKRETSRLALLQAATSGSSKFFAGTDSAPHATWSKESACGCAGVYTAHAAVELYCEAFERVGALENLEGFLSHYGADYYGLPRNKRTITLEKKAWKVPMMYDFGGETVTPLRGGETVAWSIVEN